MYFGAIEMLHDIALYKLTIDIDILTLTRHYFLPIISVCTLIASEKINTALCCCSLLLVKAKNHKKTVLSKDDRAMRLIYTGWSKKNGPPG